MKIIFIDNNDFSKEKISKFISEDKEFINSKSLYDNTKRVYKSSYKVEELLKEINLKEDIINDIKNIQSEDGVVIVINNESNKYHHLNADETTSDFSSGKLEYKNIKIMLQYREVYINNKRTMLTSLEYKLLVFFINNQRKIISKKIIIEYLLGEGNKYSDPDNSIYTHVKNLKKKLISSGAGNYIHTVYGQGYKFESTEEIVP